MPATTEFAAGTFGCPGLCSGDASASKAFYSSLLGWEPADMRMPDGEYTMFKLEGQDVAGMYEMAPARKTAGVLPHWNSYIAVADAAAAAAKAAALGGKVIMEPFDADGDLMANLEDPAGAKFSVWQSVKPPEPARLNEIGALCWSELYTTDAAKASAFYSGLFDWRPQPFTDGPMPYTVFNINGAERGAGGMLEITDQMPGMKPQWMPYFQVEDADRTAQRAIELGAQVHGPWDVATIGRIAMIQEPQGASFAVIKVECGTRPQ